MKSTKQPPSLPLGLVYSTNRSDIVKAARAAGMNDAKILTHVCQGRTWADRLKEVKGWGKELGLDEKAAIELAKSHGLL
jgi:hypothetical protein